MVETNVHYPTYINLLLDAVRKVIRLIGIVSSAVGLTAWRQSHYNILAVKRSYRHVQKLKHSTSQPVDKKAERKLLIVEAHQEYVVLATGFIDKAEETLAEIRAKSLDIKTEASLREIEGFVKHARWQMDQITRRVVQGENIPHGEKVFSLFEQHTEWICKGKAGVPQELGLRVGIVEDQYQFILHHLVMEKETDDKVAVPMIRKTQENFPELTMCSFDKGYHSPENRIAWGRMLKLAILPKKAKLSLKEKEAERSEEFVEMKRRHSAVESAINTLENHGLDMCPDHGMFGFKRYVALAVLARNLQNLGHIIQQKERKRQTRRAKATIRQENSHRKAA